MYLRIVASSSGKYPDCMDKYHFSLVLSYDSHMTNELIDYIIAVIGLQRQ